MLLVASETGHVYTFATPKLQPMITSEAGKALIQTCLHQPDQPVPPTIVPTTSGDYDIRMSASGYEETELGYNMSEEDFKVRDISLLSKVYKSVREELGESYNCQNHNQFQLSFSPRETLMLVR